MPLVVVAVAVSVVPVVAGTVVVVEAVVPPGLLDRDADDEADDVVVEDELLSPWCGDEAGECRSVGDRLRWCRWWCDGECEECGDADGELGGEVCVEGATCGCDCCGCDCGCGCDCDCVGP